MQLICLCVIWLLTQVASSAGSPTNYQSILWVGGTVWNQPAKIPLFMDRLRELGITAVSIGPGGDSEVFRKAGFNFYLENMVSTGLCLKWRSKVSDWDQFITAWAKDGRPASALHREYGLDDPGWLASVSNEVRQLARQCASDHPLYYDLRDELSTTLSANPFDYDFSASALAGFRAWLKTQYISLEALNTKWETSFVSWDEVRPFTTDQIKNRMASGEANPRGNPDWQALAALKFKPDDALTHATRWNFAPWADFRSYMDLSLARALGKFRAAVRENDPQTPVGIEGTQMPSAFGGYDLWRLSQSLDWVEPYDIGNAREIFGSFMSGKPMLTTVGEDRFETALRRLWHLRLLGDRGCIVWWSEDVIDFKSPGYPLTRKGTELKKALARMVAPEAAQLDVADLQHDPIAIHYSQASIQADWLLESMVDGSTWLRRFSSYEAANNRLLRVRNGWLKALQDLGYSPVFLSTEQIEAGLLVKNGFKALILPGSIAISDAEAIAISKFAVETNHIVLADGWTGVFDEHARLRPKPALQSLLGKSEVEASVVYSLNSSGSMLKIDPSAYPQERLRLRADHPLTRFIAGQLSNIHIPILTPPELCLRTHRFSTKRGLLVAFERGVDYQMSEALTQAGGNEPLENEISVSLPLAEPTLVQGSDNADPIKMDRLQFRLNPWRPTFFLIK